eukprot:TRINITY_DN608_c0_g2_i2.p1 TRINITY_DN608_c0_g2~~TRINITY_DN608_c0_g2_i2.p1  ORF type:complete len:524 (-),score=34.55 TRINITY_DN608_c0_g2_i2:599-2170(-)
MALFLTLILVYTQNIEEIRRLHKCILILPVVWLMHCMVAYARWSQLSTTGGSAKWLDVIHLVLPAICRTIMCLVLLIAATGYEIARRVISICHQQIIGLITVGILLLLGIAMVFPAINLACELLVDGVLIASLFAFSSITMQTLTVRLRILQRRNGRTDVSNLPVFKKVQLVRELQGVIFFYIAGQFAVSLASDTNHQEQPWVAILMAEIVQLFLCCGLALVYRIRTPSIFSTIDDVAFLINRASVERRVQYEVPWSSEVDGDMPPGLMVIENPPVEGPNGQMTRNVTLGVCSPRIPIKLVSPRKNSTDSEESDMGYDHELSTLYLAEMGAVHDVRISVNDFQLVDFNQIGISLFPPPPHVPTNHNHAVITIAELGGSGDPQSGVRDGANSRVDRQRRSDPQNREEVSRRGQASPVGDERQVHGPIGPEPMRREPIRRESATREPAQEDIMDRDEARDSSDHDMWEGLPRPRRCASDPLLPTNRHWPRHPARAAGEREGLLGEGHAGNQASMEGRERTSLSVG